MKTLQSKLFVASAKISSKAKLIVFIATLVMFVLAAGAPEATGSVGG
jgi:hypothetical protein